MSNLIPDLQSMTAYLLPNLWKDKNRKSQHSSPSQHDTISYVLNLKMVHCFADSVDLSPAKDERDVRLFYQVWAERRWDSFTKDLNETLSKNAENAVSVRRARY